MRRAVGVLAIAILGATLGAARAHAFPAFARETKAACMACHVNPAGGEVLTPDGDSFKVSKKVPPASASQAATYVGMTKCKMCHIKQYTGWKATPHAGAWAALEKADTAAVAKMAAKLGVEAKAPATKADACIVCHSAGYKLPGGYPGATPAANEGLVNVTCESCHGPGSKHIAAPLAEKKKYINKDVDAALCQQCHTAVMSPNFNFDDFKKRGVHKTAS